MNQAGKAIEVLQMNSFVQHGIFGAIRSSDVFPPRAFLNEFLGQGHDLCDQDARMGNWHPFSLSEDEYMIVKSWWLAQYPNAKEDTLDAKSWSEWAAEMLELRDGL